MADSTAQSALRGVAPLFGATPIDATKCPAFRVMVPRASGTVSFDIEIVEVIGGIRARETTPGSRLPAFCPERHINRDGTFCLGWGHEDPGAVVDSESAHRWWSTLIRFLGDQLTAARLQQWPGAENARAHGEAASHQDEAEQSADALGGDFAQSLASGALTVRRDSRESSPRLTLLRNGQRIAKVYLKTGELVSDTLVCPCGSAASTIRDCAGHAGAIARLTIALYFWRTDESRFWRDLQERDIKCCGTITKCPLNSLAEKACTHE